MSGKKVNTEKKKYDEINDGINDGKKSNNIEKNIILKLNG